MVCDWQRAASDVLVAVGKRFVSTVMEELLSKFQPGALPHCSVVQTLANLAASNGRCRLARLRLHPGACREGLCTTWPRPPLPLWGGTGRPGRGRRGWRVAPHAPPLLQCSAWCPS